jgi:hypothetical protein
MTCSALIRGNRTAPADARAVRGDSAPGITGCHLQLNYAEFHGDGAMRSYLIVLRNRNTKDAMSKMKALSVVIILSAAIAAPVFAQDEIRPGYGLEFVTNYRSNYRVPDDRSFRGAYNRSNAMFYAQPLTNKELRNVEDFGVSGRDASRIGGEDPYLHPAG